MPSTLIVTQSFCTNGYFALSRYKPGMSGDVDMCTVPTGCQPLGNSCDDPKRMFSESTYESHMTCTAIFQAQQAFSPDP
jgi:hypothetical protein